MIICLKDKHGMGDLANFCNQCGAKLPPPEPPLGPEEEKQKIENSGETNTVGEMVYPMGHCGLIGHALQVAAVNAKFCAVCGTKFVIKRSR
jgi:membrane protease subunit (stomatin/prohibitin family)